MPNPERFGLGPEQSPRIYFHSFWCYPYNPLFIAKGDHMGNFIQKIKNNFFRESISFSLTNLTTDGLTISGGSMRSFTLAKNQILQSSISVRCLPDLNGNPNWAIELGNKFRTGVYTSVPVPHDGIVDTSGQESDVARFTYLCNNIAHYIVKIEDQTSGSSVYSANFGCAMEPIATGYKGRISQGSIHGGFEYLVPMVPGDIIQFELCLESKSVPKRFNLEATHIGLQVRFDVDKNGNDPLSSINNLLLGNGTPISQT